MKSFLNKLWQKYALAAALWLLFEALAVGLWLALDNRFYLFNFSYIGSALALGVADDIVPEPAGGAHEAPEAMFWELDRALSRHLAALLKESAPGLLGKRYQKFRKMGAAPKEEA